MRRVTSLLLLAAFALSFAAPGICMAAADVEDTTTSHAAHASHAAHPVGGAHTARAGHGADSHAATLQDASAAGSLETDAAPSGAHHEGDCVLMLRCHWTAAPATAAAGMPLVLTTGTAAAPVSDAYLPAALATDTPPPKPLS